MYSVISVVLLAIASDGARILAVVPFPARSHWIVMEPLFHELVARGHELTVFSPFPQKKPLANYTDFDFSAQLPPMISEFSIEMIKEKMPNPWTTTFFMNEIHEATCRVLKEPSFQKLIKSEDRYDLVITELFGTECYTYFAHKFKAPLIYFTTSMALPWAAERLGLPDNPSYIPNYLVNFTSNMNLWERIYNTLVLVYAKFWHLCVFNKQTQAEVEKYFNEPLPSVDEVISNTSLMFLNSYHALAQSRPFPPNVVEVGGIHIKDSQPLSEDLKKILNNAKHGVIIMSFGSLVRSSTIPKSIIMMFMNAFAKIPQTVIFKYEEDLPDAPKNVIIKKWLSQRDLMENDNVIALIAHGGLASTIEAVHFGKPIIGIPFFADQSVNIKAVVRRGGGIQLDLDNLSEAKITAALNEILKNPKFKQNMKQLSQRFRDRPMTPLQTAVYWTEYVIRHQGAAHLRPASVGMPFYQYLLLDVAAVLSTIIILLVCIVYFVIKRILSILTKSHDVPKRTVNSKKTN